MSDYVRQPTAEEVFIIELDTLKEITRLLSYITQATEKLNALARTLSDESIRKNNLYWGYSLSSIGNPRIGDPPTAIVLANQERHERIVYHSSAVDTFDRPNARQILRRGKMPEPMIWERWPALNSEEKYEKEQKINAFNAKHRAKDWQEPKANADSLEAFLVRQAKSEAKKYKTTAIALLADAAWSESQTTFFKETMDIELTF